MIIARGTGLLMPLFRHRLEATMVDVAAERLPLRIYETVRSPARQETLYKRGRVKGAPDFGRTATGSRAYQSAHQFGDGADVVGWIDNDWNWDDVPAWVWKRFGEIARSHDLEQLRNKAGEIKEQPHVQPAGWDWRGLKTGPMDDLGWLDWLNERGRLVA